MNALKMYKHFDRRTERRCSCSELILFATRSQLYEGRLKNYSRNGLFIKTKEILPIGEIITVVDPHPAGMNRKRHGQILWRNNEGFGVELYRRYFEAMPNVVSFEHKRVHSMQEFKISRKG
jgi:hypothetical protein